MAIKEKYPTYKKDYFGQKRFLHERKRSVDKKKAKEDRKRIVAGLVSKKDKGHGKSKKYKRQI